MKIWGRPTPADVRSRSILDLLFTLGAVAALVVAIARALLVPAAATHPTWDSRHLGSVHISTDDEDLCIDTSRTTRSFTVMKDNIERALWRDAPNDQEWDATSWDNLNQRYRVWFASRPNNCQSYPAGERALIEIEYWPHDDGTAVCGSRKCNVAVPDSPYTDLHGHPAHRYYYILVYAPWVAGEEIPNYYRHQINHETGHSVGMADGDGTCPDSVMHSTAYGCSIDRDWPSAGDKAGLKNRAEN